MDSLLQFLMAITVDVSEDDVIQPRNTKAHLSRKVAAKLFCFWRPKKLQAICSAPDEIWLLQFSFPSPGAILVYIAFQKQRKNSLRSFIYLFISHLYIVLACL